MQLFLIVQCRKGRIFLQNFHRCFTELLQGNEHGMLKLHVQTLLFPDHYLLITRRDIQNMTLITISSSLFYQNVDNLIYNKHQEFNK